MLGHFRKAGRWEGRFSSTAQNCFFGCFWQVLWNL